MSIGTCIPCMNGDHEHCVPASSGCICADREHQPKEEP